MKRITVLIMIMRLPGGSPPGPSEKRLRRAHRPSSSADSASTRSAAKNTRSAAKNPSREAL
eukprot:1064201-Alexandrium_andersonii.AAC.1